MHLLLFAEQSDLVLSMHVLCKMSLKVLFCYKDILVHTFLPIDLIDFISLRFPVAAAAVAVSSPHLAASLLAQQLGWG